MTVFEVRNINKQFGDIHAVNDISFSLSEGEILGLLGPNGAGKTTTIRMILDIFKPDSGSVIILGGKMEENKKDMIGYLPEERGLYQDISFEKCLRYLASIKGMDAASIDKRLPEFLKRFDLHTYKTKKVKDLSKGMQQKAQLISTFIHSPKLVIVDEPFSALDPVNTQIVQELLFEERDRGTAIMMSTHQMNQAEAMCSRIILINKGSMVLEGNLEALRTRFAKPEVVLQVDTAIPDDVKGIISTQVENHQTRILLENDYDPQRILAELVRRGIGVRQFEVSIPSLNEIFIEAITNGENG